ncbi:MAG: hypothetical protein PHH28_03325 [Desulfuromonadaceae bacterium]|nr:hypothetical protein [Desulfuromonadaceae bacterium]
MSDTVLFLFALSNLVLCFFVWEMIRVGHRLLEQHIADGNIKVVDDRENGGDL